jgi:Cu2+-exporting ATPase
VARVQSRLQEQKGVHSVSVSLASHSAQVEYDAAVCTPEGLKKAVQDAGYDLIVEGTEDQADDEADRIRHNDTVLLWRQTLVAVITAAVMMILGMAFRPFPGKGYILWALATLVLVYCGRRFFVAAWKQLMHGSANMDTLVALSVSISYGFSVFNLLLPQVLAEQGHLYFESSAMIIAFILLGRLLEERAKQGTTASIRGLMDLQPRTVTVQKVEVEGGMPLYKEYKVPVEQVVPGDIVIVKPGERVSVDGVVTDGESYLDESMLTGESIPVWKKRGSKVYAGTVNQAGSFFVKTTGAGGDTVLASIIRMVRDAQGSKAPVQQLVDKVAAVFVPVILGLSLLTLAIWLLCGGKVELALTAMVSVLVIACPCSLGLATPTAIIAGIGNAAQKGILVKDADALQVAAGIDAVVLDKTGTVTVGSAGQFDADWRDVIKPTSRDAVQMMKDLGLTVHMLTGDKAEIASEIAREAGIEDVVSEVLPDEKHHFVQKLQAEGHKVAMVGDGINDSAALALADLSVAMGRGSDIAIDTAMATVISSDLRKVPELVRLSGRTSRIIKENLFWASIYNVLAVPAAAMGMVNPMIAAACMALSSVCVVNNSLRLRKG